MKKTLRVFILFTALVFTSLCFAQEKKPKIALVLSGGGAKGLAEIPLLEELERQGIRPDMVLGTSMGALIGSLYASGYTPKEIRETMLSLNFIEILTEKVVTLEGIPPEPFSLRANAHSNISFNLAQKKIGSAPGLVGDQKILRELNDHLSKVLVQDDFDKLAIPFRCIGTNVSTGEQIVFKSGSVVSAVRASISLPGVFTPAPAGNGVYAMDGGLRNNLPLKLARDMGADIVISMDVASVVDTDPETLSDMFSVAVQIFNLIISSNAVEQYGYADIVLRPDLKEYSTIDFFHPEEIIRCGEICVEQNRDKIAAIAETVRKSGRALEELDEDRKGEYSKLPDPVISKIDIRDVSFVAPKVFRLGTEFDKFIGHPLDDNAKAELGFLLNSYRDQYHLTSFSYALTPLDDGTYCLNLLAKHYDQNQSKIFFAGYPTVYSSNQEGQTLLNVNPATTIGVHTTSPIESLVRISTGGVFILDGSVYPLFTQYKDFRMTGDVGAGFTFGGLQPKSYFTFDERMEHGDYAVAGWGGLRLAYSDIVSYRIGLKERATKIGSEDRYYHDTFLYNEVIFTTLRNDFCQMHGTQAEVIVNGGNSFRQEKRTGIEYTWRAALEQRGAILDNRLSLGYILNTGSNRFYWKLNSGYFDYGGLEGMCGYPMGTFRRDYAIAGMSVRYSPFSVAGMPFYIIGTGKYGISDGGNPFVDVEQPSTEFFHDHENGEAGFGLYAAMRTFMGTVIFGYSMNTNGNWVISLGLR